jgi:hypothetical protein
VFAFVSAWGRGREGGREKGREGEEEGEGEKERERRREGGREVRESAAVFVRAGCGCQN